MKDSSNAIDFFINISQSNSSCLRLRTIVFFLLLLINGSDLFGQSELAVAIQHVNVRSEPTMESSVLLIAVSNDTFNVISRDNAEWTEVATDSGPGLIHNDYIQLLNVVIDQPNQSKSKAMWFLFGAIAIFIGLLLRSYSVKVSRSREKKQNLFFDQKLNASNKKIRELRINEERMREQIEEQKLKNRKVNSSPSTNFINLLEDLAATQQRLLGDMQVFNPLITAFGGFSSDMIIEKLNHYLMLDLSKTISVISTKINSKDELLINGLYYLFSTASDSEVSEIVMGNIKDKTYTVSKDKLSNLFSTNSKFSLLSLLKELKYPNINQYISYLHRVGLVLTKADKAISEKEKSKLQELYRLLHAYTNEKELGDNSNAFEDKGNAAEQSLDDLLLELNTLIGLDSVKKEIDDIKNYILIQKARKSKRLKTSPLMLHCVFTGNPGSGKTTVARLLSKIYKQLGVLQNGHLVEVDRESLVASYVGQTAPKVNAKIKEAMGGTLFIDEAYSLTLSSKEDFGSEAISTLLKRMEDSREELAVIVAGYPVEMKSFIESNPGLKSRFNRYINFPDYSPNELFEIVKIFCKKEEYELSSAANSRILTLLNDLDLENSKDLGNGRLSRNIFKMAIENQASRLCSIDDLTKEDLISIKEEDVPVVRDILNN